MSDLNSLLLLPYSALHVTQYSSHYFYVCHMVVYFLEAGRYQCFLGPSLPRSQPVVLFLSVLFCTLVCF